MFLRKPKQIGASDKCNHTVVEGSQKVVICVEDLQEKIWTETDIALNIKQIQQLMMKINSELVKNLR